MAILFRPGFSIDVIQICSDPGGRFLILDVEIAGVKTTLCNVYGPNSDDPSVFEHMCTELCTFEMTLTILGGDLNLCMNNSLDRVSSANSPLEHTKCKDVIVAFAEDYDLVDAWREQHPNQKQFTCVRNNPPSKSRIDFFLVSRNLLYSKSGMQSKIRNGYLTDHRMVSLQLDINNTPRGKSYWKLNNSLLQDESFVEIIRRRIPEILDDNESEEVSRDTLFHTLLAVLRGEIIAYAAGKFTTV